MESSKYSGVFFTNKFISIDSFNLRIKELDRKAIFKSDLSDPCNFLIPKDISKSTSENCRKGNPPIPDLENEFLEHLKNKNISGLKYFVLNNMEGWYFRNLKNDSKMNNGFSNGVFINENDKEILYWIIIW